MDIDWEILRRQKATLVHLACTDVFNQQTQQDIMGVVHLLDAIQDCAVDTKEATINEVFGDMTK